MLDITIPSITSSVWRNKHFVSFKVVVQTDDDHWTLRRPYSDFAALDEEVSSSVMLTRLWIVLTIMYCIFAFVASRRSSRRLHATAGGI